MRYRLIISAAMASGLVAGVLAALPGSAGAVPVQGLAATYYDNQDFTGAQVARVDPTVDFSWGVGAPATGIGADTFSVRWSGQIKVDTAGTYTFIATTDDGSRLRINGTPVISAWTDHSERDDSGQITLSAGTHNLWFEFYENGWDAVAKLSWSGPGISRQIIPATKLSHIPPQDPISATTGYFVDPNSHAAVWVRNNSGDGRAVRIKSEIADRSTAAWFGDWSGDVRAAVSGYLNSAGTTLPTVVAYNIPNRDCNGSGGSGSADAYRAWIRAFAEGVGTKPAIVIIEPDAIPHLNCGDSQTRRDLLRFATEQLRDKAPNAWSYLDGGSPGWVPADETAQRLDSAGVRNVRGFSVNVSSFQTTDSAVSYVASINNSLANRYGYRKQAVIDTSRNGNGANSEWCNPSGRKLGVPPQRGTGEVDLLLWVKMPGDSDGNCGIAPNLPAGTFSPDLATRLIEGW